jgi:NADP-dependent aldehyde dehydrogenase
MITGKNYIGNTLSARGQKTYKTINPVLNIENETAFVEANSDEINEAITLAEAAYIKYNQKSGPEKAAFLNAIADEILALDTVLIETYCSESGLPQGRAQGERGRTIGQLRAFAAMIEEGSWIHATIDTGIPDRAPAPKPDLRKMLVPLGPVVVFA